MIKITNNVSNENCSLDLWIPGRIVPKARPRFFQGKVMLPQNYRAWKNTASLEIIQQISNYRTLDLPVHKASVEIQLLGKHVGDLDNLGGSILDILTETEILLDDRLSCVSRLLIEHHVSKDTGASIKIFRQET